MTVLVPTPAEAFAPYLQAAVAGCAEANVAAGRCLPEGALAMVLARIGLHVFGHNPGAQALYAQLGYGVTGLNMAKPLKG
jgi:hypothetical protein